MCIRLELLPACVNHQCGLASQLSYLQVAVECADGVLTDHITLLLLQSKSECPARNSSNLRIRSPKVSSWYPGTVMKSQASDTCRLRELSGFREWRCTNILRLRGRVLMYFSSY